MLSFSHLETIGSELSLPKLKQGHSCPATSHSTKCFPIWQPDDAPSVKGLRQRKVTPYKAKPIRQAPEQQTVIAGPRSVSLRWPDEMQHAVFFTDDACNDMQKGRPEYSWHVERFETQVVHCESPPAGLFRSVEYMRQEEYEAFSRRMRGQVDDATKIKWRGLL